jgi:hypothetical protein
MERVYWIDAKLNLIGSSDLDGANSRVILYSPEKLKHPFSITLFEDWMYWTDWDRNAVFKANKFDGSNSDAVTAKDLKQIPMAVHVYHPYRQPDATNYCRPLNGHCSHICVPAPQITSNSAKTSCICPNGYKLKEDGLNCVTDRSYIHSASPESSSSSSSSSQKSSHLPGSGFMAGVIIGAIAGAFVLSALVIVALYRRFWYKSLHNINFDNPVYRPSKCTEENVNMPDRETSLLPQTTDHTHHHYHQSIGVIPGFPTALPSASSTTISFSSSGSSSAIDPNSATRTFTSTTLVQDATEGILLRDPLISLS